MRSDWKRAAYNARTWDVVETGKMTEQLEKALTGLYRKVWNDLQDEVDDYFAKYTTREAEMIELFKAGEITAAKLAQWRLTQTGRGERWESLRNEVARKLSNVSEEAAGFINSTSASIYALNRNYQAYRIESTAGVTFNLINDRAVRELVLGGNHVNFRTVSPNPIRNYQWNQQLIQRHLTSSIMQGRSVTETAASFLGVMQRNEAAAIRNARTATTSAYNAGCQEAFDEAEEMGIVMMKEWICTKDGRTRDSHADLDGERVPADEPFSNGLMYPADPSGDPSEVYNCRCTMRSIIEGYEHAKPRESYREWEKRKRQEMEAVEVE